MKGKKEKRAQNMERDDLEDSDKTKQNKVKRDEWLDTSTSASGADSEESIRMRRERNDMSLGGDEDE